MTESVQGLPRSRFSSTGWVLITGFFAVGFGVVTTGWLLLTVMTAPFVKDVPFAFLNLHSTLQPFILEGMLLRTSVSLSVPLTLSPLN